MVRINLIPYIDIHFFKLNPSIVLLFTLRPPLSLFPTVLTVKISKALLHVFHSGYMLCQTNFLHFLAILFSNTLSLRYSLNVNYHVSQLYSTTGNIIVKFSNS
jgi:hypothetical protein